MSMTQWYFMVSLLLGIFAIWTLVIGLRGIVTRRPVLISGRVGYLFNVFVFLVFMCVSQPTGEPPWWVPVGFVVFLIVAFLKGFFMKPGYTIFGVTHESFQKGLLASLTRLNLPYEDSPSGWRLPTIADHLEVKVYPLGGRIVRMEKRQSNNMLRDIAKEMTDYYRSGALVSTNMNHFIWYLLLGVAFALTAFGLAFGKVL